MLCCKLKNISDRMTKVLQFLCLYPYSGLCCFWLFDHVSIKLIIVIRKAFNCHIASLHWHQFMFTLECRTFPSGHFLLPDNYLPILSKTIPPDKIPWTYVCIHVCMYVFICVCMYVYIHIWMYVCMRVCVFTQGRPSPPETMMHFPPCFRFPPYLRKIFGLSTNFLHFYLFAKNFLTFIRQNFWWPFFKSSTTNFEFPPCFAKIILSPLLLQISPPVLRKFTCFLHTLRVFFPPLLWPWCIYASPNARTGCPCIYACMYVCTCVCMHVCMCVCT